MGRQKPIGTIDVIGSASSSQMNQNRPQAPRENVIQVMTADRREYSRMVGNPQGSISFNPGNDVYYNNDEPDPYSYGYEPTQDTQQWDQNPGPNWAPREIKELTGGMSGNSQQQSIINIPPPSLHVQSMNPMMPNPMMIPPLAGGNPMQSKPPMMMDARERRDRDMQPRTYDQRKRMRSNSRDRDRSKDPSRSDPRPDPRSDPRSRDTVRESTRERESSQRDRRERPRTDDRRERDDPRRTEERRDRSRDRKRSRSKERTKRSRSKDKKSEDSKDRRSSTKKWFSNFEL